MRQGPIIPLLAGLGLAAILSSQLLLFTPITLYAGNIEEFDVALASILKIYLAPAIIITGLLGLFAMLLGKQATKLHAVLAALIVCVWLQGNVLVWNYGLLDGRAIDWSEHSWRGWLDSAIWLALLGVALFATRAAYRYVVRGAVALFCLQLVFVTYTWWSRTDALSQVEGLAEPEPIGPIYEFSTGRNVLHILADGFQSDIFQELISDGQQGQRLGDAFDGFTFFREHLGVFPYTQMSIPAFLSGTVYRNHVSIDAYMDQAVGDGSFLNAAHDAGYLVDMAVPSGLLTKIYRRGRYANFYTIPASRHVSRGGRELYEALRLIDLSLFRISPHFLKKHVYNDQLWLVRSLLTDERYMSLQFFSHIEFLRDLRANMRAERSEPVYKYLHLMLSHNPMVTNEDCSYAGRVLPTVRHTVKSQARCALIDIVELLEGMKELGIYEDALIVVMADHGAWVTPTGFTGSAANTDGSVENLPPSLVALALPLLAVKLPGDSGPLRISDVPSSITDIPATVADGLELPPVPEGTSVFELDAEQDRERRFLYYQYQRGQWTGEYLTPIQEFVVKGRGVDTHSWRVAGVHLPPTKSHAAADGDE